MTHDMTAWRDGVYAAAAYRWLVLPLPARMTWLLSTGEHLTWRTQMRPGDGFPDASNAVTSVRRYQPGPGVERWFSAPVGPAFRVDPIAWPFFRFAGHTDDGRIYATIPAISPADPGHFARSTLDERRATLIRNGLVVATSSDAFIEADVPPERADYTLDLTARGRPAWSSLDTEVHATWRFASEMPAPDQFNPLALLAVRARGAMNADGVAPAGAPYLVTLEVERLEGAPVAAVTSLALEVSYDEGKTWRSAPVARVGDRAVALLWHPARAGFVSLRSHASDAAGDTVLQTVIRAYATR
jgi:hypothetical protein